MANCVFPALPLPPIGTPGSYDQRTFKVGEPVCLRNQQYGIESGTYESAHKNVVTGLVDFHYIKVNIPGSGPHTWVKHWYNVGKVLQPVSPTAVNVVARKAMLPNHLGSLMKGYGRKRKSRSKKLIRSGHRRHTGRQGKKH